jgi:SAM-dependent methyltransferase
MTLLGIALGIITVSWLAWNLTLDALWQPTNRVTVRRMLFLASVKRGEHVFDLGCGDGRIVVAAARDFGAHAMGIEIDPFRVLWAKLWIRLAGLSKHARVIWGNMYTADLSDADVIVLFLSAKANSHLQPHLKHQLKPGARIVSYYHPMWGWEPDEIGQSTGGHPLYLYRIGDPNEKEPR